MVVRAVRAATIVVALGVMPRVACAQSVRGTIVGSAAEPLTGVIVALLDSTLSPATHTLSDARGAFRLTAPAPGAYRLRTLRIGYQATTSDAFLLAAGQEFESTVRLSTIRLQLDTVRVVSRNACRTAGDSTYATFAIWEQVHTALTTVQLTSREADINSLVVAYEREMDRTERLVRTQTSTLHSALAAELWHSAAPERLRRDGFVVDGGADSVVYFAPGIDALLSREFVEDHCFRLSAATDQSLLGISFEPTPDRKRIPEVRGTLWLDRATAELRRMEFGYMNLQRKHLDEATGAMEFVRMRDGRWAVARWNIRMPVLMVGMSSGNDARVAGIKVAGGELVFAVRGQDSLYVRPPMVLAGVVVDSVSGAAVGGARLALAGTNVNAVADAFGRFMLRNVLPGEYTLEVRTASLDSVPAVSQSTMAVTDAVDDLRIRVPTGPQIAISLYGAEQIGTPGIVIGTVGVRGDSIARAGVRVAAEWAQPYMRIAGGAVERGTRPRWIEARSGARGRYRLCGVPVNIAVMLRAESDSAGVTEALTIPPGGRLARTNLVLEPVVQRGATFTGVVVADVSLLPIMDAVVSMPDFFRSVKSNEQGAFRFTAVPAGTHRVLAQRKGLGSMEAQIAFSAGETAERRVVLSPGQSDDEGVVERVLIPSFEENRRAGIGVFMTRTELDRQRGRLLSEVLSWVKGFSSSRGGCNTRVYMDNALMTRGNPTPPFDLNTIATGQVEALEYYRSSSETPMKYRSLDASCGVLVVWTRR